MDAIQIDSLDNLESYFGLPSRGLSRGPLLHDSQEGYRNGPSGALCRRQSSTVCCDYLRVKPCSRPQAKSASTVCESEVTDRRLALRLIAPKPALKAPSIPDANLTKQEHAVAESWPQLAWRWITEKPAANPRPPHRYSFRPMELFD